jgi:ketosteroid isomerase-like protein
MCRRDRAEAPPRAIGLEMAARHGGSQMPTNASTGARTIEYLRMFDAKDVTGILAGLADDAQGVDEITRGWLRDRAALEAYFRDNLPHISDLHSTITDMEVRTLGDLEVETCMMHQTGAFDGTAFEQDAPTTTIWRREGETWRLVLVHSIPLSTES